MYEITLQESQRSECIVVNEANHALYVLVPLLNFQDLDLNRLNFQSALSLRGYLGLYKTHRSVYIALDKYEQALRHDIHNLPRGCGLKAQKISRLSKLIACRKVIDKIKDDPRFTYAQSLTDLFGKDLFAEFEPSKNNAYSKAANRIFRGDFSPSNKLHSELWHRSNE